MKRPSPGKSYAQKFINKMNKRIGMSRPKTWSGKGGSTSKYGGSKSKVRKG